MEEGGGEGKEKGRKNQEDYFPWLFNYRRGYDSTEDHLGFKRLKAQSSRMN